MGETTNSFVEIYSQNLKRNYRRCPKLFLSSHPLKNRVNLGNTLELIQG